MIAHSARLLKFKMLHLAVQGSRVWLLQPCVLGVHFFEYDIDKPRDEGSQFIDADT